MTDPAATPATPAPVDRDALKARATELGVDYAGNVPTAKLAELVAEAEALEAATAPAATPAAPVGPAPSAADVTAAADTAAVETPRVVDGIEVTGPQSAVITGTPAGVAAIITQLREHGGSVVTDEGHVISGPITGRAVSVDGTVANITVAFPIVAPAEA